MTLSYTYSHGTGNVEVEIQHMLIRGGKMIGNYSICADYSIILKRDTRKFSLVSSD